MTCRPSEGRPPQAIQARHQPDVAGAPSERLVAPRFCGVSIMEADQCFTITHCAVSEAASSANKSWWKRDHFRIAVLAFDLVIRFPGGTIRSADDPDQPPVAEGVTTIGADPDEGVPYEGPATEPLDHGVARHLPGVVAAPVNQVGCRNRVTRPAEPFTWSLRAAANSSRVIPGCSAFGSRSVAIRVQVWWCQS